MLIFLLLVTTCFMRAQSRSGQSVADSLYWESVLDAYSAFVKEARLVRENKADATVLQAYKSRISELLKDPKGKMTASQQARFERISSQYANEERKEPVTKAKTSPDKEIKKTKTAGVIKQKSARDTISPPNLPAMPVMSYVDTIRFSYTSNIVNRRMDSVIPTPSAPMTGFGIMQTGLCPEWIVGLMAGLLHPSGWGGFIKVNALPVNLSMRQDYSVPNEQSLWTNGSYRTKHMSFAIGVLRPVGRVIMYVGAGYGSRLVFWQDTDEKWAKIDSRSKEGVELDLGGIIPMGRWCVSAGLSSIALKTFGAEVGIGLTF